LHNLSTPNSFAGEGEYLEKILAHQLSWLSKPWFIFSPP